MKNTLFVFSILISLINLSCTKQPVVNINLNKNWQFKQAGTDEWLPAIVPGCVHTDLLENGIIEDPFFGDNEQQLQWIENENWEYETHFYASSLMGYDKVDLVFSGLDTYAEVYLNDSAILVAENMFREWVVDCKNFLKQGENSLYIKFTSPVYMDSVKASQVPYSLPDIRGYSRKAPYQYGWDWGPRFVTSGVWKPILLRAWNEAKINNLQIVQNNISEDSAYLTAVFEIESIKDQKCRLQVSNNKNGKIHSESEIKIKRGINFISLDFAIADPKRWWPNGLGEQPLYEFNFQIQTKQASDNRNEKIGLRTIELIQEPDSIGSSFYFLVNGVPVFMKGANYIPQDNFPSRVSDEKYQQTIQTAVDANMNMLRVWGGGIYEKNIFYELCDEKGILVWQDFMFACNMVPGDEPFRENVHKEAIQQVIRLRNHPSIAIWCGNNEVSEGWHNWGWQKSLGYSEQDSLEVWNAYFDIFEKILPGVVSEYDSQRSYWPSSPSIGWGHKEAMYSGDMHYWGVWWGEEPFEVYEDKVGRFMTEYGFQGFPDLRTFDSCLFSEDKNLQSPDLLNHQKHPRGMELIQTYMEREYVVPEEFEKYAYVSQLVQAYGIKKALEAHRRAMPYCMGTLYWQLNDCWPVISWSSVDYYNWWKALHYFTKDTFKDFLISFEERNDSLFVFVVSDKLEPMTASLDLKILDFDGEKLWSEKMNVEVEANSSSIFFKKAISGFSKNDHLFSATMASTENILASNNYYFLPIKELKLPDPDINKEIVETENGYQIRLKSNQLAKNVFLSIDEEGFFSDNYFDLLPGENKEITFKSKNKLDSFTDKLKVISLIDTF